VTVVQRLQQYHTTLGVNSPVYRRFVSTLFLSSNPFYRRTSLDSSFEKMLERFKLNGIIEFDENFAEMADLLVKNFFEKPAVENLDLSSPAYVKNLHSPEDLASGLASWIEISILNPTVFKFFTNPRLVNLVTDYYGRQAYYRNLPVLSETSVRENYEQDATYKFHVDYGLKQVSFMLLLNDVTETDTHMIYAKGSQLRTLPHKMVQDRNSFPDSDIFEKYEMEHVVGKKGTLFIFDAGNGLHRAMPVPGTRRRILHMNLTTGHYMLIRKKIGEPLRKAVRGLPVNISRAFKRLID
jgi:hypothetical protein